MKVFVHNLGCDKNKVDGEKLAGRLKQAGFHLTTEPGEAELVIVNTCGFIGPAKEESLETVFSYAKDKKVAVAGCLAKRYGADLKKELREADIILGLADSDATFDAIIRQYGRPKQRGCHSERLLSGPTHSAALKIAEGCGNLCSYCAIPSIRGKLVSRPENEILREATVLRKQGVKELLLVAQDITAYEDRKGLPRLLKRLCRQTNPFEWIRLMYCHPGGVTDELIDVIAEEKAIVKYIDLPLQHIADPLLLKMNRHYTRQYAETLLRKLRERVPGIAIRTTFISGFPGESKTLHRELVDFIRDMKFDRMGAFPYSLEEGTRAARFAGQVGAKTAQARVEELMFLQSDIIFEKNRELISRSLQVLADEKGDGVCIGRTYRDAPEVDCNVILRNQSPAPGTFLTVKITDAVGLDLYA